MRNTPIERKLIDETIADFHITDFAKATIREVKAIAANAEAASGVEFIKMEMGVPGQPSAYRQRWRHCRMVLPASTRTSTDFPP